MILLERIIMIGITFLMRLSDACGKFHSRERNKKVTKSELKRWCNRRSVIINGEPIDWDEEMDFDMLSIALFPKGRTVTLL